MSTTYFHDITNAIKTMHYRHGIGDVKQVRIFGDGRIEVDAKGTSMKQHTRKGRLINGRTIKMYGHQLTVTIV